jgi:PKD repeat protein
MKKLLYTFLFLGTFLGCSKIETTPITPKPTADFSWTESIGGTVQFTNNSKNADSYQWDFGDNLGKSTSQNPKYTFEYKGDYQVKLTARNAGSEVEAINTVKISTGKEPKPIANFDVKDLGKGNFQFTNTSQYADTYLWDFGDNTTPSKDKDVQHQYFANAKFKITLTATGKGGVNSKSVEVEAKDVPDPRDVFVGNWAGPCRLEINGKFDSEGKSQKFTITKSSFANTLIISANGQSGGSFTFGNHEATVIGNKMTYDFTTTIQSIGEGIISSDGKTLNLINNSIITISSTSVLKSTCVFTKL